MRRTSQSLLGALTLLVLAGCGGEGEVGSAGDSQPLGDRPAPPSQSAPAHREPPTDRSRPAPRSGAETVAPSRCPAGVPECRTTKGRIVYVERVDPDGDGDAHFVLADPQGITLPGLTVVDVRRGLRPDPLPGPGELISAAGPVQAGSYGQSQIHALELHVAGR